MFSLSGRNKEGTKIMSVKLNRVDGYGFVLGTLVKTTQVHGHDVYHVKTLTGREVKLSARDYQLSVR